jgi:hypothetical protein
MNKNKTGDEALRSELDAMAEWHAHGSDLTPQINEITARNVLRTDLGFYSDIPADYDLDEATRDRLIAHCRQDAAHAVIVAGDIFKAVKQLKSYVSWLSTWVEWSSLICITLLGLILWRVW